MKKDENKDKAAAAWKQSQILKTKKIKTCF